MLLDISEDRGRYDPLVHDKAQLKIDASLLKPGMRLGVGVSGGADSVALLRGLHERAAELGLVLTAAHLHHGLRGAEADGDLEFCRALANELGIPFLEKRVDTAAEAAAKKQTIEEAARHLRYAWFRELMAGNTPGVGEDPAVNHAIQPTARVHESLPHAVVDAIATAHTLDDQAETVLGKFLRGAWTEGLSGIHPELRFDQGRIVRPLLKTTRAEVEAYLRGIGQAWREDSTNRQTTFTRNRIRHELLPVLEGWNPRLKEHLAEMAVLARDEEAWWAAEVARVAQELLLRGRPVRGGGRAAGEGDGIAIDGTRLAALAPAMQRRLLRYAAGTLGAGMDFRATESLREMALGGRAGQKLELEGGLRAERTPRELRLTLGRKFTSDTKETVGECRFTIPGVAVAPSFGIRVRVDLVEAGARDSKSDSVADSDTGPGREACLRNWRAGDRVRLRYTSGPRKVKEVLERLKVTGSAREIWPVLEVGGQIVWMRGVEVEPVAGLRVTVEEIAVRS